MSKLIDKLKKDIRHYWCVFSLSLKHFYYYPCLFSPRSSQKTIILCVNGWVPHGAWTDRLKGIISAYSISKRHGFQFKIWYDSPCELSKILTPTKTDWQCTKSNITFNLFRDKVIYLIDDEERCNNLDLTNSTKKKHFIYLNIDLIHDKIIWKDYFENLFAFNDSLVSKYKAVVNKNERQVAFVFRFITLFGDYKIKGLTKNSIKSNEEKEELVNMYIQKFGAYYKSILASDEATKYYIFSDSDYFTSSLKEQFSELIVLHDGNRRFFSDIEQNTSKAVSMLNRIAFDFYFLSKCTQIVHFIDGKHLYSSGFPLHASFLSKKENYRKIIL